MKLLFPSKVLGYRPFINTDAAVAEPKEMKIEFEGELLILY